jgi:hypothetical protein
MGLIYIYIYESKPGKKLGKPQDSWDFWMFIPSNTMDENT